MYILASDYDGTLNRGGVSPAVREAIADFRAAGNLFGIVTGRGYWAYDTVREAEIGVDFILAMNGAMVIDPASGEVTDEVTAESGRSVLSLARMRAEEWGQSLGVISGKRRMTVHGAHPDGLSWDDGRERCAPLSRLAEFPRFSLLDTRCPDAAAAALCAEVIRARFGETMNPLLNGRYIDIPPAGTDKGEGLSRTAARLGVPMDRIFCAGDSMNDFAMLARFRGLAVENAVPELKEAAEGVFPDIAAMIAYAEAETGG